MIRRLVPLAPLAIAAAMISAPLAAQTASDEQAAARASDGTLRINQVVVYGDDPCPDSDGDDIVVCGRLDEDERYRIPPELRGNPNDPRRESWTSRVRSLERVGRFGTDSCSPVGAGGFTGCTSELIRNAYAEREQARGTDWTNAVAEARRDRMAGFDAESEAIEAQVTRDEQARVERERAAAQLAPVPADAASPDAAPLPNPQRPPRNP